MKGGVQRLRVPAFIQGVFMPKELSSSILQYGSRINGTGANYRNFSAYGNVRNIHSKNSTRFSVLGFCNKHYISVTSPTTLISPISISRSSVLCRDYRTSAPFSAKKRDYYEVLGVSKGSGKDEVKKKYFELAKKYHPDANKGSKDNEAKFAEISEAYEVLSDDSKKQQYDMFGHQDDQGQGMRGNPFEGFGGFGGGFGGGFHGGQGQQIDVEELFNAFGFNVGIRKGANAAATVELSFLEAANGCEKDLKYDYTVKSKDNPRARGTKKSQTLKFKIPAGVIDGMALRVEGKGGEGPAGTPNGDLVITIVVKDDPFFRREGTDIHIDVPITLSQAIMGCTVDVLTLDGMVELKIPAGAQPDARLMMRSKGMRFVSDNMRRGHQICHIKIKIPNSSSLSEQQRMLLLQFEEEENKRVEGTANTFNFDSALKRVTDFNKSKKE